MILINLLGVWRRGGPRRWASKIQQRLNLRTARKVAVTRRICTQCLSRRPRKGKRLCTTCTKLFRANQDRNFAAGLCRCGKARDANKGRCRRCAAGAARNTKAAYHRRLAAGLCGRCGEPNDGATKVCARCLSKQQRKRDTQNGAKEVMESSTPKRRRGRPPGTGTATSETKFRHAPDDKPTWQGAAAAAGYESLSAWIVATLNAAANK